MNQSRGPDGISLNELVNIIWQGKWITIAITSLCVVAGLVLALSLPNIYEAQVKLAPNEESGGSMQGGGANQLGGLANLAGIQLGPAEVDKATLAIEILMSRKFLSEFIESRDIVADLMAVESWDSRSGDVVYDSEYYNAGTEEWYQRPTMWESVSDLQEHIVVTTDDRTGFTTLTVRHRSPVVARDWADWLVEDINNEMRLRDVTEAERSRDYIEGQLADVNLVSVQQIFYQLMEKQIQTIMMANVRPEYVFQVIDPAVIAEEKSAPSRSILVIVAFILGLFLSFLVVLLIHIIRTQKDLVKQGY